MASTWAAISIFMSELVTGRKLLNPVNIDKRCQIDSSHVKFVAQDFMDIRRNPFEQRLSNNWDECVTAIRIHNNNNEIQSITLSCPVENWNECERKFISFWMDCEPLQNYQDQSNTENHKFLTLTCNVDNVTSIPASIPECETSLG